MGAILDLKYDSRKAKRYGKSLATLLKHHIECFSANALVPAAQIHLQITHKHTPHDTAVVPGDLCERCTVYPFLPFFCVFCPQTCLCEVQ